MDDATLINMDDATTLTNMHEYTGSCLIRIIKSSDMKRQLVKSIVQNNMIVGRYISTAVLIRKQQKHRLLCSEHIQEQAANWCDKF